ARRSRVPGAGELVEDRRRVERPAACEPEAEHLRALDDPPQGNGRRLGGRAEGPLDVLGGDLERRADDPGVRERICVVGGEVALEERRELGLELLGEGEERVARRSCPQVPAEEATGRGAKLLAAEGGTDVEADELDVRREHVVRERSPDPEDAAVVLAV